MEKLGSPEVGGREGTPDREALFNLLTSERRPEGRKGGREIEPPRKDPEVGASQVWSKNSRRPGARGRRAGESDWRGVGKAARTDLVSPQAITRALTYLALYCICYAGLYSIDFFLFI